MCDVIVYLLKCHLWCIKELIEELFDFVYITKWIYILIIWVPSELKIWSWFCAKPGVKQSDSFNKNQNLCNEVYWKK